MIPDDLKEALKVFQKEDVESVMVYRIRDIELLGWDGPRVLAWAKACDTIRKYVK